jgi:excisionase family DNA binding protein
VRKNLGPEGELNLAAEQLIRSLGVVFRRYPSIGRRFDESIYYLDSNGSFDIRASASGPLDVDATMAARQKSWTVPELAKLHNLSTRGLYDLIKSGRLPSYRIGTAIRLCPATTQLWFRNCLTGAPKTRRPA